MGVAEKEPYTQLNPPTAVIKPEAIRFAALAVPVNDGLAVGAFASSAPCRPEVLAMLSDASGQVKAPVQVRGVLKVLPAAAMEKSVVREAFWNAKVLYCDWKVYIRLKHVRFKSRLSRRRNTLLEQERWVDETPCGSAGRGGS